MTKTILSTEKAPQAIGPYSQAVKSGDFIFTSGMLPLNPTTGEMMGTDIAGQTEQVLKNLSALLESAGSNLNKVIKTLVFLKDMNDFAAFNEIYKKFFSGDYPARSCVEVARLPKDSLIEIEMIAQA